MAQRSWAQDEPLEPVELPTPEPGKGEVRVAIRAIGVNPVDWKMCSSGPMRLMARAIGPRLPFVPGVDFAGVVDAVGEGVKRFRPGTRVVGATNFARGQRGSYADVAVVREDQLCALPDEVDLAVAATLPVAGVTARMAVIELGRVRHAPESARRVLVLGASGGVGQMAVQVARLEGAAVTGVCSGRNAELVRSLGAATVLDYTLGDLLDRARDHGPFQVVIDCVGGYSGPRCRALLGPGGRHVMVSGDTVGAQVQAVLFPFRTKSLLGRPTAERMAPLVADVAAGRLRVLITRRMPLDQAQEAHRLSRSGRMAGKIILEP